MICTQHLEEKKSPLCYPCSGLFTKHDIKKGAFVCFLTGSWSLQSASAQAYPNIHPAAGYVAVWDAIRVPKHTRARGMRTDNLVVISRTRHSLWAGSSQLCRTPKGYVRDTGALMNSQPQGDANCMAESVVLSKSDVRHAKSARGAMYPAIIIVATRVIRAGEELTWPYVVPGVPVVTRMRLRRPPFLGEAMTSQKVLQKWGQKQVPRDICGPPLYWNEEVSAWEMDRADVDRLNVTDAFIPTALPRVQTHTSTAVAAAPDEAAVAGRPKIGPDASSCAVDCRKRKRRPTKNRTAPVDENGHGMVNRNDVMH